MADGQATVHSCVSLDQTVYPNRSALEKASKDATGTPHTYFCNTLLRNALQQFAWQSTKLEGWARAYYERKRAEGKSHSMAIRCLANVWVRIIYAMWQSERPYQTAVFEAARQQHRRQVT